VKKLINILIAIYFVFPNTAAAQYDGKLGINLGSVHSDAYVDMIKGALPFDKGSPDSPLSVDELDENGWPLRDFRLLLMDNRPVAEWADEIDDPDVYRVDYSGTYKVSFSGQAEITNLGGPWSIENYVFDSVMNRTTFDLVIGAVGANHGLVIMYFANTKRTTESSVNSGISNLKIIRPGYEEREDQYFTDHFISTLTSVNFSTIRSQNFSGTTSWNIVYPVEYDWDQRKLPTDPVQSDGYLNKRESSAWEHFIDLCNMVKMDIWVNVPISASDNYITGLAQLLYDSLDPGLNIYVENDNEVWNSAPAFVGTYNYNAAEAADLGITDQENIGRRAVELSNLFASVFGQYEINNRIRVVLASHAPMVKWWVTPMLNYINNTYGPPKNYIYAISRQTYFSSENASDESKYFSIDQIINECFDNIDSQIGEDQVNESNREDWIRVANEWELPGGANSYEGGPHTPAGGSRHNIGTQINMHRSQRMIRLLRYNIVNNWFDLGGELAMYFTLVSRYSRYGCWGLTDDLRKPDRNYKMEALRNLETVTALTDITKKEKLVKVYPNPSSGLLKVKLEQGIPADIEIIDIHGNLIFGSKNYQPGADISTRNLESGMYIIKITNKKGTIVEKILIK